MGNTYRSRPKYKIGDIIEGWMVMEYRYHKGMPNSTLTTHYMVVGIKASIPNRNKTPVYYYVLKTLDGPAENVIDEIVADWIDIKGIYKPNSFRGYRKIA
jgi:hypothetical protein